MVTLKTIIHNVFNTKGLMDILVPFKKEIIDHFLIRKAS